MLVCGRPRLGDPIWHNLCSASHAASPDFAGIVCALCTNAMHPVFCKIENALRSCRSATRWDIHPRCGVRLPRPFAFAASRIADRHQARPEGSALTTAGGRLGPIVPLPTSRDQATRGSLGRKSREALFCMASIASPCSCPRLNGFALSIDSLSMAMTSQLLYCSKSREDH
jgi:hypothetical protein